jgi:glutathione S-transferase
MHYAEGSAMPPLLLKLVALRIGSAKMPFFVKPVARRIAATMQSSFIDPQLKLHFGYVEGELAKSEWFVGNEFSAADVQMSFPLEAASHRAGANRLPHIRAFLERIHARPAYRRALERGGKYDFAD